MKKSKQLFVVLVISSFIMPQIALAAWWNPFTWSFKNFFFFQKTAPVENLIKIDKVNETDASTNKGASSKSEELSSEVEKLKKEVANLKKNDFSFSTAVPPKSNFQEKEEITKFPSLEGTKTVVSSNKIVTLSGGSIVELDSNNNIVRVIQSAPQTSKAPVQNETDTVSTFAHNQPVPQVFLVTNNLKPIITKFESSKYDANLGEKVTISWHSQNAIMCTIGENQNVNIPFTGRTPSGEMVVTLEENTNHRVPTFDYYATCADKDWNIDTKKLTITINAPRFTSEPIILTTYRSGPDQEDFWHMEVQVNFVNANGIGWECSTNDPRDFFATNQKTNILKFSVPETGLNWGKTYNCIFDLQKNEGSFEKPNLSNSGVTQIFTFTTPEK